MNNYQHAPEISTWSKDVPEALLWTHVRKQSLFQGKNKFLTVHVDVTSVASAFNILVKQIVICSPCNLGCPEMGEHIR